MRKADRALCAETLRVLSNPEGINQYSGAAAAAHEHAAKEHEAAAIGNVSSSIADKATSAAIKASDKVAPGTIRVKRSDGLFEVNQSTSAGKASQASWKARESEKQRDIARGPQAAQSAGRSRVSHHEEAASHHREQAKRHRGED